MFKIWRHLNLNHSLIKKLDMTTFNILIYIAAQADDEGYCEICCQDIAQKFNLSQKKAQKNIDKLKAATYENLPVLLKKDSGYKINIGG